MADRGWSKRGYGCAFDGDKFLALGIRYHKVDRRIRIEYAWSGDVNERSGVAALARHLHRKPFWTPLKFLTRPEISDVKICNIDAGDKKNRLKGTKLDAAVIAQLQPSIVHSKDDYIFKHCPQKNVIQSDKCEVAGAFAPRAAAHSTEKMWQKLGVIKVCVGSSIAGLANLFLAVHPIVLEDHPLHRLVAFVDCDAKYFCFLTKQTLVDSGVTANDEKSGVTVKGSMITGIGESRDDMADASTDESAVEQTSQREKAFRNIMSHLQAWGRQFTKQYGVSDQKSIKAYLVAESEDVYRGISVNKFPLLELWMVPWIDRIDFASKNVEETVVNSNKAAVMAMGMALHGVRDGGIL